MARFKENANMFSIADPMKAPMMHGHTCIELRDVKTGKRERVESDNTFMANTLSEFMGYMGYANNAPLINGDFAGGNILTELCGGVLLFRDTIPANSKYMNAGNEMTANGSYNISNNTTPVELGTWNTIESNVEGNSSAVLVWDWDTAHGNGQISSVCLTSANGGYIGYGNKSGVNTSSSRSVYNLMPSRQCFTGVKKYYNNMGIKFAYAKPIITITKYRYSLTKASVFDKRIKSTAQIDLTDYNMNYDSIMITNIEHDKAMIYTNTIVQDNTEFKWLLYNYADGTVQVKTLMNATGRAIYPARTIFLEDENVYVCDVHNSPWKILVVNPTTGAIIKSIDTNGDMGANIHRFAPNLLYYSCWNRIIDLVNETQYSTNGGYANFDDAQTIYDSSLDAFIFNTANGSRGMINSDRGNIVKNQMYLATINNLDNAVTKSNTQTMKVTYTLTEV